MGGASRFTGTVSAAVTRNCLNCAVDLTDSTRTRIGQDKYLCPACYQHAKALQQLQEKHRSPTLPAQDGGYPCRVCGREFAVEGVYGEPSGTTVCKSCWQAQSELPAGLEFAPDNAAVEIAGLEILDDPPEQAAPAPAIHQPEPPDLRRLGPTLETTGTPVPRSQIPLFCETCNGKFSAGQLKMSSGGAVLCKACAKIAGRADRKLARSEAQRQRALANTARQRTKREQRFQANLDSSDMALRRLLTGIIFVIGGLSGKLVLRGTNSPMALVAFGALLILWEAIRLMTGD